MAHTFFESVVIKLLDNTPVCELADVSCPWPAPALERKTGNKIRKMRDGVNGPGLRIAKLSGASAADFDLALTVAYCSDAQHAALASLEELTTAFQVSIDSGATFYRCVLADDGYKKKPWEVDFYYAGAEINIHILGEM